MMRRWLKFNTVGAIGVVVQLAALAILNGVLGVQYMAATALAVEIAVLHNFVWHERWTWREHTGRGSVAARLARFNLTTGALSILSNVFWMRLFAGQMHMKPIAANLLSIAVMSLANFLISERFVFRAMITRPDTTP